MLVSRGFEELVQVLHTVDGRNPSSHPLETMESQCLLVLTEELSFRWVSEFRGATWISSIHSYVDINPSFIHRGCPWV